MKDKIIELIENKIQELRAEISEALTKNDHKTALIVIAQVNILRSTKHEINKL